MIAVLLKWLGSILSGPIINAALSAYKAKLDAGTTSEAIAVNLATRELALEQREAELNAERAIRGPWWSPSNLLGYVMVSFIAKVVVWDSMLGWGTTYALHGDVQQWGGWIMAFWLGKRGVENVTAIVAQMLKKK